jgi:hypothetical protein
LVCSWQKLAASGNSLEDSFPSLPTRVYTPPPLGYSTQQKP